MFTNFRQSALRGIGRLTNQVGLLLHGGVGGVEQLFLDTFMDVGLTLITAHDPDVAPPGWAWALHTGDGLWEIEVDGAGLTPLDLTGGSTSYGGDLGVLDFRAVEEFQGNGVNPAWPGIVVRRNQSDVTEYMLCRINSESDVADILSQPGGATLASGVLVFDPGDAATIEVTVDDDEITAIFTTPAGVLTLGPVTIPAVHMGADDTLFGIHCRVAFGEGASDRFDSLLAETL